MKLLTLDLLAFGPFSNLSLHLADGAEGLHVVYGPNEAGKSSALRALRQMLFGIPLNSPDNFIHNYKELRVSATLRRRDGSTLACIRRKANKNSLRAADDVTAIDESVLRATLGGVDEDAFRTVFGIDHETLVRGGEEIARGGGDVGRILFSAGAGLAGVRSVQNTLEDEMERLFAPRGSLPLINRAVSELNDARRIQRDAELPTAEWLKRDESLRADRAEFDRLDAEWKIKQRELRRLERIQAALPVIAQLRDAEAALQPVADAVLMPKDFGRQRHEALVALHHATADQSTAEHAVAELDSKLAGLTVPEATLAEAEVIEQLHKRLGAYHKAMEDRRSDMVPRHDQLLADARALLADLQPGRSLDQVEDLRLTTAERVRVQDLGVRHQAMLDACSAARNDIDRLDGLLRATVQELTGLPAPADTSDLRRSTVQAQRHAGLEEDARKLRQAVRQADEQAAVELKRLPLWSGSADDLERLNVPGPDTVERFRSELDGHAGALKDFAKKIAEHEAEIADVDQQLQQLRLEQTVPTEDDLDQARRRRDEAWQLVRQAWLLGQINHVAEKTFVAEHAPAADLATAYESAVQRADQVADRLRREANRVAQVAALVAQRQKLSDRLERLRHRLTAGKESQYASLAAWNACWQPAGIEPGTPKEMAAWMKQHDDLARRVAETRKQRIDLAELEGRLASVCRELGACLARLDGLDEAAHQPLSGLIERSEAWLARHDAATRRRERLQGDIASHEKDLEAVRKRGKSAERELADWQTQWSDTIGRLPLPHDATPTQANAVLGRMGDLFEKLKEVESLRDRLAKIDRESVEFARDVEQTVARLASDRATVPFDQAAALLHTQLGHAQQIKHQFDSLAEQRRKDLARLEQSREVIRTTRSQLETMCAEAGCESYDQLAGAEERSTHRRELANRTAELRRQVLSHSGGAAIDTFIAEAAQCDADSIATEIARLAERIDELARGREALGQKIAVDGAELRKLDGTSTAADAAERVQELLAQIDARSREYVRMRLASAVLRQAIERYRDKHQGSVLRAASRLFAGLTLHSFEGLKAEYNDKGDAELVGVRPDGKTVEVSGLSDGTRDQLYLALRLASLETYSSRPDSEPVPFLVDDVLLNFDDDRAAAALRALADLSRRTQVIFFTHHRRLVELAREHLDADTLFVHDLDCRAPAIVT